VSKLQKREGAAMMLRGMGALPSSYEDCHALMCRSIQGYQPTFEENWACSQLRGTFEGKSFSPLDCVGRATPPLPEPAPIQPLPAIVAAISPEPDIKFPPIHLVPNQSETPRFGWRIRKECYPKEPTLKVGCETPMWFWLALGIATVAGLSNQKGKAT
jgi:hypothetical protein